MKKLTLGLLAASIAFAGAASAMGNDNPLYFHSETNTASTLAAKFGHATAYNEFNSVEYTVKNHGLTIEDNIVNFGNASPILDLPKDTSGFEITAKLIATNPSNNAPAGVQTQFVYHGPLTQQIDFPSDNWSPKN